VADAPWQWTLAWGDGTRSGALNEQIAVRESPKFCTAGVQTVSLTVRDKDGGEGNRTATLTVLRRTISVLLPGAINARLEEETQGLLPVTVLSEGGFDATTLDAGSVRLGAASVATRPDGTPMAAAEDVDADGDLDLVLHFERAAVLDGTQGTQVPLSLTGTLTDGCTQVVSAKTVRVLR
ncbi:MAG: hypothetical protein ACJ8AO_06885, partial [Gemmatimonadaceae bacterium]